MDPKIKNLALMCLASMAVSAETIEIVDLQYSAPIKLVDYVALGDTAGIDNVFDPMRVPVDVKSLHFYDKAYEPTHRSLIIAKADVECRMFTEADIKVEGVEDYAITLDGKPITAGKHKLHPATHTLVLRYVTEPGDTIAPAISIATEADGRLRVVDDGKRMFTLNDVLYGTRVTGVDVSPTGSYILVSYTETVDGGKTGRYKRLFDTKAGKFVSTIYEDCKWMPKSDRYLVERTDYQNGRHIVAIDPATGRETIVCANIPDGYYRMSPDESYLLYTLVREGAKEDPQIYQVIEPEDRQPGWRDRVYPAIYRFDDPVLRPIAVGKGDLSPIDISDDGSKLLLMSPTRRLTQRPTTLYTLMSLDLGTMRYDTIIANDGFISAAAFMPNAQSVVVMGSPESLDRVGCTLADSVIPSAYDYQLYFVSLDGKDVKPLTRDFAPSVNDFTVNRYDGKIYLTATERDMYTAYSIDPGTLEIRPLDSPELVVKGLSMADSSPMLALYGQSDSRPDAVYTYNLKSGRYALIDRPSEARLSDVRLGQCVDWTFTNPKGETVYARYYLPDNFDPAKQYPLIVNYYGGCTPSTRTFESRYPMHVYSSLGYVTLVIQPSGCTGFGQDWSSRHVSTAGKGVAEDIIAGTEQFCQQMPFVNKDKIGCIGASYGGFMTQYLQTLTPMFAAAISHAGISDHTSYWGEGYWGYSYSEVSMGDDLPWTNPDLYVKQSPLYNADKIHTPILFLHGDADTNVPVGESIQMFTALKRLGVETALVQVTGQNHHIMDDSKRKKWQDTIFAWFAKYLQDDPTWWDTLYPAHYE